ncbi:TIR domain-containing protein [Corallococcus exiguus]|uniref:TIR domain-containing protein n=1 Tax=Corallococcus exiguus TaxID=83462 RepID=UPI003DA62C91
MRPEKVPRNIPDLPAAPGQRNIGTVEWSLDRMPITRRRETLFQRLERFFFGDDIFISYSREDCAIYAADLARRLSRHGFSCLLDQWRTQPGREIPPELLRAIRRSGTFVLLGTHGSAGSQNVCKELEVFLPTGRTIIPVDFGGAIGKATWKPMIDGLYVSQERQQALTEARASRHLVGRIVKTADFIRRNTRLKGTAAALCAAILLAALVAGERVNAVYNADQRARAADERAAAATKTADEAGINASAARGREIEARRSAADAGSQAAEAETRAVNANLKAQEAEARRADAVSRAAGALKEAEQAAEAQRTAESLRGKAVEAALAASGERISGTAGRSNELEESVTAALVTYLRLKSSQSPTANGLRVALTNALVTAKQQGLRLGVGTYPQVECFDLSADGTLLLTGGSLRPQGDSGQRYTAALWEPQSGRVLDEIESGSSELTACAMSPNSRRVAMGDKDGGVRVIDTWRHGAGGRLPFKFPSEIVAVQFTASGEQLIVWAGKEWNGDNLHLVDIRSGVIRALPFPKYTWRFFGYRRFFGQHQRPPPFIGAIGTDAQLTLIRTETGVRTSHDLRKHFGMRKDDYAFRRAAVVSPNGRWLFVAPESDEEQKEGSFLIDLGCSTGSRKQCRPVRRLAGAVLDPDVAFDPAGRFLVVGGSDAAFHVFDITAIEAGGESTSREIKTQGRPRVGSFSADGGQVATISTPSGEDIRHVLEVHNLATGRSVMAHQLGNEFNWGEPIFRQSDTGEVYVGLHMSNIYIWERQPTPGFSLVPGRSTPGEALGGTTDATVSPDGRLVATAHVNGKVALWRREDRELNGIIHGFEGEVFIQWGGAPGQGTLYAASKTGQLIKWSEGENLVGLAVPTQLKVLTALRVSKNGQTVAVRGPSGAIAVLAGQEWQLLEHGASPDFALSGDGHLLAIGDTRGGGKLVDLRTKKEFVLGPYWLEAAVMDLRFVASDSRVVARSSVMGNIVIWDVRGGPPLGERSRAVSLAEGGAAGSTAELAAELDGVEAVHILNATDGREVARVLDSSLRNWGSINAPSYFGYSASEDLAVAGWLPALGAGEEAVPGAQLLVWQVSSGQPMSRIPLPRRLKRIELIPGARALLLAAVGQPPVIVPLQLEEQFSALCPLVLRTIEADREGLVKYAFCKQEQNLVGGPFTRSSDKAWQLTTAPRSH